MALQTTARPIRAGELRHRITIEQVTETRDVIGGVTESWSTFATRWAAVEPLAGREYFSAQQEEADVDHRIRLRYLAGVVPKMRVKFGARLFDIQTVLNLDERKRELHLMARERQP